MNTQRNSDGIVRTLPKNANETREIPFVLSTGKRDRRGLVLNPDKWELGNFKKNPVVGYGVVGPMVKADPDFIIGQDINPRIENIDSGRALTGVIRFDPASVNLLAERVFRKILWGSLRACQTDFLLIGNGRWGVGDEAEGREKETFYAAGQELLQWSIVNIPFDSGAGARSHKIKTLSISALSYALQILGKDFSPSRILEMRVSDVTALLNAKDHGLKTKDPRVATKLLSDPAAIGTEIALIESQQRDLLNHLRETDRELIDMERRAWLKQNL